MKSPRTPLLVAGIAAALTLGTLPADAAQPKPRLLAGPQLYRLAPQDPGSDDYGAAFYRYAIVAHTNRTIFAETFEDESISAGDFTVLGASAPDFTQDTIAASNPQGECFVAYIDQNEVTKRDMRSLERRRIGQRMRVTLTFISQKAPVRYGRTVTRHPALRSATFGFRSAHDQRSLKRIGCARR